MREFDKNGLLVATFQAKLFEESIAKTNYSSPLFLRRFKYAEATKELDNKHPSLLDLNRNIFFKRIKEEFGESDYGEEKYDKATMYWLGYIYRYICYTRQCSTKFIFDLIPPSELKDHYYVYHTQSEEWVINRILENKGLTEDVFDKNERMKKLLKEQYQSELLNI